MLASGEVGVALAHSALRVLVGGGTGAALGLVVGLLVGRGGFGRVLGSPLALVRPIPPIAWIPLTLLWFGVGELQQWAILAGATFHVVTAGVRDALDRVPASLVESAKNLGSRGFGLELVRLRAAAPELGFTLREGLAMAWFVLVAAELVSATEGIGVLVLQGRDLLLPARTFVGMLTLSVAAGLSDALLRRVGFGVGVQR